MNFLNNILIQWYMKTVYKTINQNTINVNDIPTHITIKNNSIIRDNFVNLIGEREDNNTLYIELSCKKKINLMQFKGKLNVTSTITGYIFMKHQTLSPDTSIRLEFKDKSYGRDSYIETLFDCESTILVESRNTIFDIKRKNQMTYYGTYAILEPLDRNNPEYLKLKQQHQEKLITLI